MWAATSNGHNFGGRFSAVVSFWLVGRSPLRELSDADDREAVRCGARVRQDGIVVHHRSLHASACGMRVAVAAGRQAAQKAVGGRQGVRYFRSGAVSRGLSDLSAIGADVVVISAHHRDPCCQLPSRCIINHSALQQSSQQMKYMMTERSLSMR